MGPNWFTNRKTMDFVIVGTFDLAAYYETRVVLMVLGVLIALYHLVSKRESRYLVIFLSGALLMGVTEYLLQREGLRGDGGMIALFGWQIPRNYGSLLRGILDGGVFGLMALWFADLRISRTSPRASSPTFGWRLWRRWLGWLGMSTLILVLGVLTGSLVAVQSSTSTGSAALATSVQPVFSTTPIVIITSMIFFSLLVAWHLDAVEMVANFYAGLLIITLLNLGPLHILGARYIEVVSDSGTMRADLAWQIAIGTLTGIFEVAGGKLYFLTIPLSLRLIAIRERPSSDTERLSYQHLQSLTNRGWRRKSKPFRRNSD